MQNTTKYDINLGDLRYKIPAMQTRNLLSKTAYLSWAQIEKSKTSGSISLKLKNGSLREVSKVVKIEPPRKTTTNEMVKIRGREKSSVVLNTEEYDEKLNDMMLNDEEELLQELQAIDPMTGAPLVHQEEEQE